MNRFLLSTFFFLLSFLVFAGKTDRAFKNLEKQNFERAEELFKEALTEYENSPVAYYGLSLVYFQNTSPLYNIDKAYTHVKKAMAVYELASKESLEELWDQQIGFDDLALLNEKIENVIFASYLEKGTPEALVNYMNAYPEAFNIQEARKWRNKLAYERTQKIGTAKAFADFMEKFPDSEEAKLANEQKNKLSYIELLEKQKELDEAIKARSTAENNVLKERAIEQKQRITFLFVVVIIVVILLGVSIFSFIKIKKANIAIREQKNTIEEQNKQIIDSIRYAKFIQDAILPKEAVLKSYFSDAFIFFRPRDIVSGDFYWFTETDDKILVAAVDCTGHGVPGAFMSMIGHTLLNQIVHIKGIQKPDEILFELRKAVIQSLNQKQSDEYGRDGMDMALVALNKDRTALEFSGAYNPLYLVKNKKLVQVKADRQPIAIHFNKTDTPFTLHKMSLEKGDQLYIFSDGYADQFGGPNDKKFSYKRFREALEQMENLSGEVQKQHLATSIDQWMGDKPAVDDMLVIGLKV